MRNKIILNTSNINPKSLDIELSLFSSDMKFTISTTDKSFSEELLVVSNSLKPGPNNKTLLCPDTKLLTPLTDYILEVSMSNSVTETTNILFTNFPAPIKPTLTTHGSRLINIQFNYPIQNLYDTSLQSHGYISGKALSNFYIKYFNTDIDQGDKDTPTWPGYIITELNNTTSISPPPFTATESADKKSLLIQSNIRSLPLGNHRLQIATSKIADHGLFGKHLSDFSNRDVPISEVDFTVEASEYSGVVKSLTVISPQQVEVKFSFPVLTSFGLITVDSVASTVSSPSKTSTTFHRKANTLDTLVFEMDENSFISAGPNLITLTSVVDCYGLLVNPYTYAGNLELPHPKIVSILQDKLHSNPSETKIDITFSHQMNKASAENSSNYFINKKNSLDSFSVKTSTLSQTKVSLILNSVLLPGIYTLHTANITDIYGSPLSDDLKEFTIVDISIPLISEILGTQNASTLNDSILIKFTEPMTVQSAHGIDKGINFKLASSSPNYISLENTISTLFKNNSWVRFNLNTNIVLNSSTSLVKAGYITLDKVFYVTDLSGNVLEFCSSFNVNKLLPILTLINGTASITESNQITYTLSPDRDLDEMFEDKAFVEDFVFIKSSSSEKLTASSVLVKEDLRTLVFTFDNVTFISGVSYEMMLNTGKIMTNDILSRPITLPNSITVTNELRPEVLSSSTVWVDNLSEPTEAVLVLNLSDAVNRANLNDFIVHNGEGLRLNVSEIRILNASTGMPANSGNILELTCNSPVNTNALASDLLISTAPGAYIYTGYNNRKLKPIENLSSLELYPIFSEVVLDPASPSISNSVFKVVFNKPIAIAGSNSPNGTTTVALTVFSSTGPNPTSTIGNDLKFVSLKFGDILELRSDIIYPTTSPTPPTTSFSANLTISDNTLAISFPSDITNLIKDYFTGNNIFVSFELLPLAYNLFSTADNSFLNETVTVKFPFEFSFV